MEAREWSQAQVARSVGVTTSCVSRWLNSEQKPTVDLIRACAAAFEVSVIEALLAAGAVTGEELRSGVTGLYPDLLTREEVLRQVEKRLR
jgi:transcriptional regulator with XRE-family HTH domain